MFRRKHESVVLRKFNGRFDAVMANGDTINGGYGMASSGSSLSFFILVGFALVCLIALVFAMLGHPIALDPTHSMAFAGITGGAVARKSGTEQKKPAKIREMEANLKSLAKELETGQSEMAAGPISAERGEELEQKAHEMEELQDHIDRYNKIAGIVSSSKQVDKVTLPGEDGTNTKTIYTTPGHLFIASKSFDHYRQQGKQGWSAKVDIGRRFGKKVRMTGEAAAEFERKAFDPSTLSDLGTDAVIYVDRDPEIVRYQEPEILTIRDVLNVVPTQSDAIKFVRHTATTRGAATQATRGGLKNYLKLAFEADTVSVETIAVLSKVTEQDVDDAPRLVGYINGEMTLDVRVEEERQLTWGDGSNGSLKGLFNVDQGMDEFDRAAAGDTVIDTIRKMRTDLRKRRVSPNFVAIDPLDWEEIELAKGTTEQYIWGLVTDLRGPRIWSLRVVESDAMTNLVTGERRVLVGDGVRGATLYDRSQIQLAIGYVDDDFARNLRTLRAEERLALAVKRPFAFEYAVTAEAGS
jgi:HK97 family phage major capsid protein